jgi:putative transposase
MDRQIREARVKPLLGWEWLARLPAQSSQQVLKDYVRAWHRFHRGLARPPKFKKPGRRMAVDVPQASALNITRLNYRWGELSIPLVGRVRFRWTRPMPGISRNCSGRITGARLIRDRLGWHISLRIEEPVATITANLGPPVGVDRGVIHTMALSNGEMLDMPRLLTSGEERRLLGLERKAARQQLAHSPGTPMSARHRRTLDQIAGLRAKQARRREDWLHRKTTDIAKRHGIVVVEGLRIHYLSRSARGTVERPGRNVSAKAALNRSILGMAWGKTERMLTYKCSLYGGVLVQVDPRNSSKECARCGHTAAANREDRDTFRYGCNNDIVVSVSTDGGASFTGTTTPVAELPSVSDENPRTQLADQWWQWAARNPKGGVTVAYYDRKYGGAQQTGFMDITMRRGNGSHVRVTNRSLPPTQEFPEAGASTGVFVGDYMGLAVGADGRAHPVWTDTRNPVFSPSTGGDVRELVKAGQGTDIYTRSLPG